MYIVQGTKMFSVHPKGYGGCLTLAVGPGILNHFRKLLFELEFKLDQVE